MPGPLSPLLRPYQRKLWAPGQIKPSGPWKINWDHPLTNGLVAYYIDTGAGAYVELVSGSVTVKNPNNTAQPVPSPSPYGSGFKYLSTATINSEQDPLAFPIQSWAFPYTASMGFYSWGASSTAGSGNFFGINDASANTSVGFYPPTTTTIGISIASNASPNNFTYAANGFNVVVVAATASSAFSWWANGLAQTAGTTTTTATFSGSHATFNLDGFSGSSAVSTNSTIFFGAIWKRALNAADAVQLYADPYCLLVPLEPEMMIIQVAAAVGAQEEVNWTIFRPRSRGWGH